MLVPGSNNLRLALSVLGKQKIDYYAANSRTVNANGVYESTFDAPVSILCAVQPVQRSLYDQLGLDLQKYYVDLYIEKDAIDIQRNTQGDQFVYNGRRFQVLSNMDWFAQDGWVSALCVQINV